MWWYNFYFLISRYIKRLMKEIYLLATDKTPMVKLSPNGELEIAGKSIPEDAEDFFSPVLRWLDEYINAPAPSTLLSVNLEYFNISSSKRILFILYKLNELVSRNQKVNIKWLYDDQDEDMYEVGQDYAFMVKIPFEFVEIDRIQENQKMVATAGN